MRKTPLVLVPILCVLLAGCADSKRLFGWFDEPAPPPALIVPPPPPGAAAIPPPARKPVRLSKCTVTCQQKCRGPKVPPWCGYFERPN